MKKLLVLFILAFLAGCSSSPTTPKEGIKKIRIVQTTTGLDKREIAAVSNPVTDTIHLGNIYKDVPFTFILQNAGTAVINNLIVKPTNPVLQVRRDTLGELALPDQQTIVPILELLVRSAGTSPWTNELIPDADTGYGAGALSFYDGDSLISNYTVDFNVKMAKVTITRTLDTINGILYTLINTGNCDAYLATTDSGKVNLNKFVPILSGDTLIRTPHDVYIYGGSMSLNSQTLRSDCQFGDESLDLIFG